MGQMHSTRAELMEKFGVTYYEPGAKAVYESKPDNLYSYKVYVGSHVIVVEKGESACALNDSDDENTAVWISTPGEEIRTDKIAIVIQGYTPPNRMAMLPERAYLPYVNGCSTAQIFPPLRAGDPTLQWLDIPPYSAEQAHHIHSTVRVVYIVSGKGRSIVGMEHGEVIEELKAGMVLVLEPMCPHHFDTPQGEHLICVPFHVFSSTPAEFGHPMFLGTHLTNQGE